MNAGHNHFAREWPKNRFGASCGTFSYAGQRQSRVWIVVGFIFGLLVGFAVAASFDALVSSMTTDRTPPPTIVELQNPADGKDWR